MTEEILGISVHILHNANRAMSSWCVCCFLNEMLGDHVKLYIMFWRSLFNTTGFILYVMSTVDQVTVVFN